MWNIKRSPIYIVIFSLSILLNACVVSETPGQGNTPDGGCGSSNDRPTLEPKDGEFVILFTNDFHSQIDPTYDNRGGIKRIKALVDSVRNVEPAVLLADAGDLVQGTYYFTLLNGVVEMMILEELGYDVRTLGNHEFDKKMTGLANMLALSSVPVVASNYDFTNTSISKYIKSSMIITAGKVKVGFVGMNVRLLNLVEPSACEGVEWQNAIYVVDDYANNLRKQGAEIVIAISHLGYSKGSEIYYDRGIGMNTRHIDMIIGGHSHTTLREAEYVTNLDGDRVPIVQTGSRGVNLGYAKIVIDDKGRPSFTYKLIPVDSRLDARLDSDFSENLDEQAEPVRKEMAEVLGEANRVIYRGTPESPLGNLSADGLVWMADKYYDVKADVAIYNSGGIRANISPGPVTMGDVVAVYPFDNFLTLVTMKGSALRSLFDYVASSGGGPVNSAVKLVISGSQVKSVTLNGKEIDDNAVYTVATIDYLVNLGRYGFEHILSKTQSTTPLWRCYGEYFKYLASQNANNIISATMDGRVVVE